MVRIPLPAMRLLTLGLLAMGIGLPAAAGAAESVVDPALDTLLDQRVTVAFRDQPLTEVLQHLESLLGDPIVGQTAVVPAAHPIDLQLTQVRLRSVCDAVAEQAGLDWGTPIDGTTGLLFWTALPPDHRLGPPPVGDGGGIFPPDLLERLDQQLDVQWDGGRTLVDLTDQLRELTGIDFITAALADGTATTGPMRLTGVKVRNLLEFLMLDCGTRYCYRHEAVCFYPGRGDAGEVALADFDPVIVHLDAGEFDAAGSVLNELLDRGASAEVADGFFRKLGDRMFLGSPDASSPWNQALQRLLLLARERWAALRHDPRYIELLIRKLAASEKETIAASRELISVRSVAVPALVAQATGGKTEPDPALLRRLLVQIGTADPDSLRARITLLEAPGQRYLLDLLAELGQEAPPRAVLRSAVQPAPAAASETGSDGGE